MAAPAADAPRAGLLGSPRGRRLLFAGLYLCEGAPMGFLWWALPVQLRAAGVPTPVIARLVSLLVLPWALKVLWAPALDGLRSARFTLRGWIVAAQLAMGATLLPLLVLDPVAHFDLLAVLLMLHATVAATQDAAIDTLAVHAVPVLERGAVTGWMQVGMLAARALFGGGALLVAGRVGGAPIVALLVALLWACALVLRLALPAAAVHAACRPPPARARVLLGALTRAARRRSTWLGVLFAAVAGAGFKALTALAGPILVDHGADQDQVGLFFLFPAVGAMALGAVLGGRAADRWGRRRAAGTFEGLAALIVAAFGLAAAAHEAVPPTALMALLALLYLAIGLATAAAYALFMDLTDPALAATQFCAFMGAINLCEAWSTRTLGALLERWGEGPAICALALPSLGALALLPWMAPAEAPTERIHLAHTGGDRPPRPPPDGQPP